MMNISDEELINQVILKNQNAFNELTKRYGRLIESIVRFHLKDLSMWQEDCVNDILFSIWQNADRFNPEKNSLKNWIGAISKYRSINYKKKFYKELISGELSEEIADERVVDADIIRQEIEEETLSLLSAFNPVDREIFIRRYLSEESIEEISQKLNKKPDWLYNRISRGKKRLRKFYFRKENLL